MPRRPSPVLLLLVVLGLIAGACATEAGDGALVAGGSDGGFFDVDDEDLDEEIDEPIAPETGLGDDDAPSAEEVVQAALRDSEAFWERAYPEAYGEPYEPISGGFWAYGPGTEQPPCGSPPPEYSDIAANAFYCPPDDLIAWDAVNLIPDLYERFGGFTLGIVFAHELAHAVQARAGVLGGDTIMTELQADCFAGAWTADVEAGNSEFFEVTLSALDRAVAGFLELRDGVGVAAQHPSAHGTGFDRIGSFSEGYELGVDRCVDYPDLYAAGQLVIVEVPFTSQDDFLRGGNLPLDQAIELALLDLEHFWSVVFRDMGLEWEPVTDLVLLDPSRDEVTCGETFSREELVNASFYCVDSDVIYLDGVQLVPALYEIGDYAVATELARQYAYAAQVRLGNTDSSVASNLQADCFAGVYASSGFLVDRGEDQALVLSPGDLDEAVIAFLQSSDTGSEVNAGEGSVGTAFQRFDAYRSGFVDGIDACEALLS